MNTVLGHYPDYAELAVKLNASHFNMPASDWNRMSRDQQWMANRTFLDKTIGDGNQFVFAHHPQRVRLGSWFFRELQYLHSRGVTILPTLSAYVP